MSDRHIAADNHFGAEVRGVKIMGREEERRFALRIAFAKIRLDRELDRYGLDANAADGTPLPPAVDRRRLEWHALRVEMVERNLYLVLINVERHCRIRASRSDLIQEGAASLFRAVDGFDWKRGLLFRTYAVHWLNQAFRSHIYNFGKTVRVPVYLQKASKHVNLAIERLGDAGSSSAEIARLSGLPERLVTSVRSVMRSTHSLNAPIADREYGASLQDMLSLRDDEGPYRTACEDVSIESGLAAALARLSQRERHVVGLRFGLSGQQEHTLGAVAKLLGVSLERVRQIQLRAITKLRTPRVLRELEPFVV